MRAETQAIKDKILEAALSHVAFDGWSRKVLDAAAADAGVDPAEARVLFPDGGDDLNRHLDEWAWRCSTSSRCSCAIG
jgi:ubiquinone biosynthesis protein COQ9